MVLFGLAGRVVIQHIAVPWMNAGPFLHVSPLFAWLIDLYRKHTCAYTCMWATVIVMCHVSLSTAAVMNSNSQYPKSGQTFLFPEIAGVH